MLPPFDDFDQACRAVLAHLRADTGLAAWALTRIDGEEWILLAVDDTYYGLRPGVRMRWADSICARMIADSGPQAAPDTHAVANYRDAPLVRDGPVRAYIGAPVQRGDGSLYGTLCGFDPAPREPELSEYLPQVQLHARLLGTLLERERVLAETTRRAEGAELEASTDPLTGAWNRRGWSRLLEAEDERCRRHGLSAGVLTMDLDYLKRINDQHGHAAGDALLISAARALGGVMRDGDALARLGGDEFVVLLVGVDASELAQLRERAEQALRETDIAATMGAGLRNRRDTLAEAYRIADLIMLETKRDKRARTRASDFSELRDPEPGSVA